MRESARRDGEKLGIDPAICLNALRIPVKLAYPDVLSLDAYADCPPPSLVDKADRKPFLGEFFQVMGEMPPEAKDRSE